MSKKQDSQKENKNLESFENVSQRVKKEVGGKDKQNDPKDKNLTSNEPPQDGGVEVPSKHQEGVNKKMMYIGLGLALVLIIFVGLYYLQSQNSNTPEQSSNEGINQVEVERPQTSESQQNPNTQREETIKEVKENQDSSLDSIESDLNKMEGNMEVDFNTDF